MGMAREIVEGFREVVRDLLIPECKALQTEVRFLGERLDTLEKVIEERFARVDERFLKVEQQIADLRADMATVNGKLDLLLSHIVDFKTLTQVTVRLEMLEKRVDALAQRLAERPS
ncbi:MAG: hypothetical protein NZ951_06070 [Dehalococcoidia bacterium]|nr:hypothetical protein [Dehalococcoidia bacterium]MDW8119957.1 hypothetical protein [Chloroflexota bacterium]